MSCIYNRIVHSKISMCEDRVSRTSLKPLKQFFTPCNTYTVLRTCSTLCMHKVIVFTYFINMRSLRPDNILDRTLPDCHTLSYKLHGCNIKLLHPYLPVTVISYPLRIRSCSTIVALTIVIKEKTRVYSRRILNVIWFRPWSFRSVGRYNKITPMTYVGGYHIVCSLMVSYCRCKYSTRNLASDYRKLFFPVKNISNLLPMCQIPAVEYRHTGCIYKA